MKKIVMMLLAVALVFSVVSPVRALDDEITEKDVLDKLEMTYTINGAEFKISPALKKIIEDYAKEFEVPTEDLRALSVTIDNAIKLVKGTKATSIDTLPKAAKEELLDMLADLKVNTSINVTYTEGVLTIYNPETGKVFEKVTDLVKQTGTETNSIAILAGVSFVVMLAGAFVVVRKVRTTD